MSVFLTWLAEELRAAGCQVREHPGWQTRARSSGGYTGGRPWGVMWHHTASGTSWDGQRDADYIATGDPSAPLANLYIDRTGLVWVLAAGATNTNGKGGPWAGWSSGTVAADSMNTAAVGVECGNDGVGGAWPVVQVDALFRATLAVLGRLGLPATDVCTHNVWAPTRKIDPATAAAVAGPWRPRSTNGSGTWSLDDIRAELVARSSAAPPVPDPDDELPLEEEADDMALITRHPATGQIYVVSIALAWKTPVSQDEHDSLMATGRYIVVAIAPETLDAMPTAAALAA